MEVGTISNATEWLILLGPLFFKKFIYLLIVCGSINAHKKCKPLSTTLQDVVTFRCMNIIGIIQGDCLKNHFGYNFTWHSLYLQQTNRKKIHYLPLWKSIITMLLYPQFSMLTVCKLKCDIRTTTQTYSKIWVPFKNKLTKLKKFDNRIKALTHQESACLFLHFRYIALYKQMQFLLDRGHTVQHKTARTPR